MTPVLFQERGDYMIKNERVIIVVLATLLVIAGAYVIYDLGKKSTQQNIQDLFLEQGFNQGAQLGLQEGYQQAIFQLLQQASTCEPVPVYADTEQGEMALNLIAIECLQLGEEAAMEQPVVNQQ